LSQPNEPSHLEEKAMRPAKFLTVLYEHPHWFNPLFTELDRRGIRYRRLDASHETFDPAGYGPDDVVFNRISPSAWTRGRGELIGRTLGWVNELETGGADVINGSAIFTLEISKASQTAFLEQLGIPTPRTRTVRSAPDLASASATLEFPLLAKPNVGGSGAGVRLFNSREELTAAIDAGNIDGGGDGVILLQEYHAPRGRSITRVETVDGDYLYGIRIHLGEGSGFDLCPADVCKTTTGADLTSSACPVGSAKAGLTVEAFAPPPEVIAVVERIARESQLDVGGIEYLESERDGERYYYDVNALSNFVADPLRVVGLDPTASLVDSIERRLAGSASSVQRRAS
jgi:glutathione synthase/RimK-type ligase-like ATP-grasp enzyme